MEELRWVRIKTLFAMWPFSHINVPKVIDALLIRLKRHRDDGDVFAYRAPKPDRQEGMNGYW